MKTIIIFIIGISANWLTAQTVEPFVIGSLGGSFSNGAMDVHFTAGETIISTEANTQYTFTQGFQQPFWGLVSIDELDPSANVLLLPNPASSEVHLSFNFAGNTLNHLNISLVNVNGAIVMEEVLAHFPGDGMIRLNIDNLEPGRYLLHFENDQKYIQPVWLTKV